MATNVRFVVKNGLDNNNNSITNLGASGSSLALAGGHAATFTTTGATNVTLPTSGTLLTTSGNVSTATALQTARTFSATGDATATGQSFDGTANVSLPLVLATVNGNVGQFAVTTVNAKGLVTAAANLSGDITSSGAVTTLATVNGSVGTFASATFNAKGLATAAANLSGDITTSGAVTTLATVNGSPQTDTFRKVTVNGKGLVTATSAVSAGDITTALAYTPVNKAGDTMTGLLVLSGDPVAALGAVTKQYVDNVSAGLNVHASCATATTATLASSSGGTITYNNGAAGVGATLTTTGSYATIGGYSTSDGQRILVKNEAAQANNGIYVRTSATVLTRATDFDNAPSGEIDAGDFTFIVNGTLAGTNWSQLTAAPITVGTTAIVWTQLSGAGTYVGGTGINIAGNTISNTGVTSIAGTANQITMSAATGSVTASLPATITGLTSVSSTGFTGALTGAASLNVLKSGDTMTGNLTTNSSIVMTVSQAQIQNTVGELLINASAASGIVTFRTNGTERMRITAAGDVGVGITPSNYGAGYASFGVNGSTGGIIDSYSAGTRAASMFSTGGEARLDAFGGRPWNFYTGGVQRVVIGSTGNVTIAAPTSGTALAVTGNISAGAGTGTDGAVMIQQNYGSGILAMLGAEASSGGPVLGCAVSPGATSASFLSTVGFSYGRSAITLAGGDIHFRNSAAQTVTVGNPVTLTSRMVITQSGDVGIGNAAPNNFRLDLSGVSTGVNLGDRSTLVSLRNNNGNNNVLEFTDLRTAAGSDWTTAGTRIQQKTDSTWMAYEQFNGSGNSGGIAWGTGQTVTSPQAISERMRINTSGALGFNGANYGSPGQVLTSGGSGTTPSWTSSAGTVTSVSVTTANGVSGTVATATTTPAISLTLGAITPSSVTSSGLITAPGFSDPQFYRISNPGGGFYFNGSASDTGAMKITLPVAMTGQMLAITIRAYEYTTNESFEIHVGGYNYSVGNTWANSPYAYIIGNPSIDRQFTVRFGYTAGGKGVIYIGELASTWAYLNFGVTEVQVGYSGASSAYTSGWVMGFEASAFENVTATITNPQVGYAVSTNTANSDVRRDGSGNFSAGTITANLTGSATQLNGLSSSTSASASTIAARDASGYLFATYLNQSSGNSELGSPPQFWTNNGGDGFLRKSSVAQVMGTLTGTAAISITGNAGSASTITVNASTANSTYPIVWHSGTTLYDTAASLYVNPNTGYQYAGSFNCNNWFRSTGNSGWYSDTHGVGIYSTGSNIVRTYNGSNFLSEGYIRSSADIYADANYGYGLVGLYSSTVYQSVFSMGDSYKPAANGLSLSNMYGIAWTHTNVGGQSKAGLSHQALFVEAGLTKTAIGTGIWTAGNITVANSGVGVSFSDGNQIRNNLGTYGSVEIVGTKGGYSGIRLPSSGDTTTGMYDGSGNGGEYDTTTGWHFYWNRSQSCLAIGGSSTASGYKARTNGSHLVDGSLVTNAGRVISSYDGTLPGTGSPGDLITRRSTTQGVVYFGDNGGARYLYYDGSNYNLNGAGLVVSGDVTAFSDIRVKRNIEIIPDALSKVLQLRGVTFTRTDTDDPVRRHTGVIAQEVEAVLPEVVTESEKGPGGEGGGIKTVAYGNMVGLLIEAVKELNTKVDSLQAELTALKA